MISSDRPFTVFSFLFSPPESCRDEMTTTITPCRTMRANSSIIIISEWLRAESTRTRTTFPLAQLLRTDTMWTEERVNECRTYLFTGPFVRRLAKRDLQSISIGDVRDGGVWKMEWIFYLAYNDSCSMPSPRFGIGLHTKVLPTCGVSTENVEWRSSSEWTHKYSHLSCRREI